MTRPRLVRSFALAAACLLAGAAFARTGSVLGLQEIEAEVAARFEATGDEPAVHDAFRKLKAKFRRSSREKLAKDVAKLEAVAASLAGPLAEETNLRAMFALDVDEAAEAMDDAQQAAKLQLAKIARVKHRVRVQAVIDEADAAAEEGRNLRNAADEAPALAAFREAAKSYAAAIALAKKLRSSSLFPQFKAPR